MLLEHNSQRIGTADAHHGLRNGINGAHLVLLVIIVHQLGNNLCIGLGIEGIPLTKQLIL